MSPIGHDIGGIQDNEKVGKGGNVVMIGSRGLFDNRLAMVRRTKQMVQTSCPLIVILYLLVLSDSKNSLLRCEFKC